jgi:hypothetical protein
MRIQSRIQLFELNADPDPRELDPDPQHWVKDNIVEDGIWELCGRKSATY